MKSYKLTAIAVSFVFLIFLTGCAPQVEQRRTQETPPTPATSVLQPSSAVQQTAQADALMEAELDKILEEQTDDLEQLEASLLA